jgi:two-component system, LytTR family, response regulator
MPKVIIIDDESRARMLLKVMLSECDPTLEIVADCDDLLSGVKAIQKLKPDLVFLDIEMPNHSGLELMDFFDENEITFKVIFTTAYSQYAIQAFKFSAIDYLLKPLNMELLKEAVERFHQKHEKDSLNLMALKHNLQNKSKKLALPQANGIRFINSDHIVYARGEGAYTELILQGGEKLLVSRNLKFIETLVEGLDFLFRCHKSYIVNTNFVSSYIKQDGGYLRMTDNSEIGISADKVELLLSKIGQN